MNSEIKIEQSYATEEANGIDCETISPMIKPEYVESPVQATETINPDDVLKRSADEASSLSSGSLPPRKRAKTKDEKEQRRIERIMRNRQAAHASREKKRRHLEELEKKCESLTKSNTDLEAQLQRAQRLQVESQERQLALQTRLQQVESALQMAKSSGDVSVLEDIASVPIQEPSQPTSECTSPSSLQLLSIPSLSNSAGNSPAHVDESEEYEPLDPFSAFPADYAFETSSKTHHPAVMVRPINLVIVAPKIRPAASIDELLNDVHYRVQCDDVLTDSFSQVDAFCTDFDDIAYYG